VAHERRAIQTVRLRITNKLVNRFILPPEGLEQVQGEFYQREGRFAVGMVLVDLFFISMQYFVGH
jgi:hypothetical protein